MKKFWATISILLLCTIFICAIFVYDVFEPAYITKSSSTSKQTAQNTSTDLHNDDNDETYTIVIPSNPQPSNSLPINKKGIQPEALDDPYKQNKNQTLELVDEIPSALTIKLTGKYLDAFNNAAKSLSNEDFKSLIAIKVGLQILQSNTIKYELALHCYSLSYNNYGDTRNAKYYSLKDCINRINSGKMFYTDCFGFARLTYSIAAYTINPKNPDDVTGLNALYNSRGAYSQGRTFSSLNSFKSGSIIFDCLTGSGSGERHVAIFLYKSGNTVIYMDQSGIYSGTFTKTSTDTYIYSAKNANPYKFNKVRNYIG